MIVMNKLPYKTMFIVCWSACLVLQTSCGGNEDTDPPVYESDPVTIPNETAILPESYEECSDGTYWTYETAGEPFLLNYCTSCHSAGLTEEQRNGAPLGIDLDTPEKVQLLRVDILKQITPKNPKMPPSATVAEEPKEWFIEWLRCGAPAGVDQIK